MPQRVKDRTGVRYGRLVALERGPNTADGLITWRCACDCGKEKNVRANDLSGRLRSCGCGDTERKRRWGLAMRTHGKSYGSAEYNIWNQMKGRVTNPLNRGWHRYGGRGITLHPPWVDFEVFYRDMGPRPSPRHSLDRIDNDGNYEPSNCRWATPVVQSNNTCRTRRITFRGETMSMSDWARRTGLDPIALRWRLANWSLERALTEPPRTPRHRLGRHTTPSTTAPPP